MGVADFVAMGQSAAITCAFLFITYKLPGMVASWIRSREKEQERKDEEAERVRQHQSNERKLDRDSRHEIATLYQRSLGEVVLNNKEAVTELTKAIIDLRVSAASICRYQESSCNDKR